MSAFIQVAGRAGEHVTEDNSSTGQYVVTLASEAGPRGILEPYFQTLRSKTTVGRGTKGRSFRKTLRRLRGFVASFEGQEARVVFVEGPITTEYWIPSKYLRTNRITERGQPFEMDEFEERIPGKGLITGTEFRPMASVATLESKVADLTPEERALRDAILAKPNLATEG